MPKRNLRVINPSNPLFAVCERCNARFTSFAYNAQEAERHVKAEFNDHRCLPGESGDPVSLDEPGTAPR